MGFARSSERTIGPPRGRAKRVDNAEQENRGPPIGTTGQHQRLVARTSRLFILKDLERGTQFSWMRLKKPRPPAHSDARGL
jgi:hypothetical protein